MKEKTFRKIPALVMFLAFFSDIFKPDKIKYNRRAHKGHGHYRSNTKPQRNASKINAKRKIATASRRANRGK